MAIFKLNINGKEQQVDVDPATPILWVLRDHLNLVGTKYGCGIAVCGTCTILLGEMAVRACALPVAQIGNQPITTIEGLHPEGAHPLQDAWRSIDVPQCGFCQSGQIMQAATLLARNTNPTDADIDAAMNGHICRCGTYPRIRAAIKAAAERAR